MPYTEDKKYVSIYYTAVSVSCTVLYTKVWARYTLRLSLRNGPSCWKTATPTRRQTEQQKHRAASGTGRPDHSHPFCPVHTAMAPQGQAATSLTGSGFAALPFQIAAREQSCNYLQAWEFWWRFPIQL